MLLFSFSHIVISWDPQYTYIVSTRNTLFRVRNFRGLSCGERTKRWTTVRLCEIVHPQSAWVTPFSDFIGNLKPTIKMSGFVEFLSRGRDIPPRAKAEILSLSLLSRCIQNIVIASRRVAYYTYIIRIRWRRLLWVNVGNLAGHRFIAQFNLIVRAEPRERMLLGIVTVGSILVPHAWNTRTGRLIRYPIINGADTCLHATYTYIYHVRGESDRNSIRISCDSLWFFWHIVTAIAKMILQFQGNVMYTYGSWILFSK